MKKSSSLMIATSLLILLSGCSGRQQYPESPKTVQTCLAEASGEHNTIEFPGRVKAAQEVNLAFRVSGTLQRFYVEEGAAIREGQLIAELDPRDYKVQLAAAEAEYNRIKAEAGRVVNLYQDSVATADAYDKARYGLQQITAKYENCKNQLADTKIYAPFNGFVQKRLFDASTVIGAGMPVLTVVSGGAPEIEINIPGSEVIRREEFSSFEATFDFWKDRTIPLRLLSVSPKANANQLYTVRLTVPSSINPMPTPGMNTMVRITLASAQNSATKIPATALFARDGQSCVWICNPDNTVTSRAVEVSHLHTSGNAVIASGLQAGEQVVSAGVHQLHEGTTVQIQAAPAQTNVGGML